MSDVAVLEYIKKLERRIEFLELQNKSWSFIPLTAPLHSATWWPLAMSTTAKTGIDLSAVFSAPAGIKGIIAAVSLRDSGSSGADCLFMLAPNDTADQGTGIRCSGLPNDYQSSCTIVCPCDANGDVYYQAIASGTNTLDVWLEIWGYWI